MARPYPSIVCPTCPTCPTLTCGNVTYSDVTCPDGNSFSGPEWLKWWTSLPGWNMKGPAGCRARPIIGNRSCLSWSWTTQTIALLILYSLVLHPSSNKILLVVTHLCSKEDSHRARHRRIRTESPSPPTHFRFLNFPASLAAAPVGVNSSCTPQSPEVLRLLTWS